MSMFRNIFAATALALFVGLAMTPTSAIAFEPFDIILMPHTVQGEFTGGVVLGPHDQDCSISRTAMCRKLTSCRRQTH